MFFRFDCKPQGGKESALCSYPIGIDPYRAGCGNDCLYCYVKHANQDRGGWRTTDPSVLDVGHLRKIFDDVFVRGKVNTRCKRIIATKLPLRVGMNTDPFQDLEQRHRTTLGLLGILKEFKYPYILLTKNSMVADERYLPLYDPEISYLEITITSLNKKMSKDIETDASPPEERLKALGILGKIGIKTAARINPLFPIYPDGYYSGDKDPRGLEKLNVFSWELVDRICESKPSTVIAGFLRLDSEKTHRWLEGKAELNLRPYFWRHRSHKYYTREEIQYYYQRCQSICRRYSVAFSVCYDCNENYEYFKNMWANPKDCCNAMGQSKCFNKVYRMIDVD